MIVASDGIQLADAAGRSAGRRRLWLWLGGLELATAQILTLVWLVLGFVDPRVLALSLVIHFALVFRALRRGLAAVVALDGAGAQPSEAQLRAADTALQRLPRTVSYVVAGGWFTLELVWLVLARTGWPVELAFGDAELLAAAMIIISIVALQSVSEATSEGALRETKLALGRQLLARGIELRRPPAPRSHLYIQVFFAMIFGLPGVALMWGVEGAREAAVAEQRRRAELSALRVEAEAAPLEGVELVARERAPAWVEVEAGSASEVVAAYDPRAGEARAAAPLADGRWAVARGEADEPLLLFMSLSIGLMVCALPIIFLGYGSYEANRAASLEAVSAAARRFSEHGELHDIERVVPLRNDTIGRVANDFNAMLDTLDVLERAATTVASGDLRVELDAPGELHDAFRGMVAQIADSVGRLRETSLEVASAAAEIRGLTLQQDQAAKQQGASASLASDAVASLAASAEEIAATAAGVASNATETVARSDELARAIVELRDQAAAIAELLVLIREVADRSDLLALNGSLEATRAGEAGRGFALVATEMRRLAERVTQVLDEVHVRVADIDASGASTVEATEATRALAQRTAEAADAISKVTRAQSDDTSQVSTSVSQVADGVVEGAEAVSQVRASAEGLQARAVELERLLSGFRLAAGEGVDERSSSR